MLQNLVMRIFFFIKNVDGSLMQEGHVLKPPFLSEIGGQCRYFFLLKTNSSGFKKLPNIFFRIVRKGKQSRFEFGVSESFDIRAIY